MKDLRISFVVFKKFYFHIYNKYAAKTATQSKNFLNVSKNPFLKGYVIEIILPFNGTTKRERLDRKYKRLCNFARFVKKHINRKLGRKMLDFYRDKWSDSYN